MQRDEVIEMARQAGFSEVDGIVTGGVSDVEAFAKLVAAKASKATLEEMIYEHPTTAIEKSVAYEREACAKVCDELERAKWESVKHISENGGRLAFAGPMHCAKAIRARGNQ
jgi:hypothetical protein